MLDDTVDPEPSSGKATESVAPSNPGLIRSIVHRLADERLTLPVEGRLASLDGATGWLTPSR